MVDPVKGLGGEDLRPGDRCRAGHRRTGRRPTSRRWCGPTSTSRPRSSSPSGGHPRTAAKDRPRLTSRPRPVRVARAQLRIVNSAARADRPLDVDRSARPPSIRCRIHEGQHLGRRWPPSLHRPERVAGSDARHVGAQEHRGDSPARRVPRRRCQAQPAAGRRADLLPRAAPGATKRSPSACDASITGAWTTCGCCSAPYAPTRTRPMPAACSPSHWRSATTSSPPATARSDADVLDLAASWLA
jgi:hypothetical protein